MGGRAGLDQANRGTQKTSLGKPGGSPRCGAPGQGVQSQHPQQEKTGLSCPSLGLQRDPVTPRWTPRPLKCDWCLRRRKPGENDGLTAGSESKGGLPDPPLLTPHPSRCVGFGCSASAPPEWAWALRLPVPGRRQSLTTQFGCFSLLPVLGLKGCEETPGWGRP